MKSAKEVMIDLSKGRYWQEGIQLIDGCTPCSPGCDHCWSAAQAQRFNKFVDTDGNPFIVEGGRFTGDIKVWPDRLTRFNTRKPKVFAIWNDLFHEGVPEEFIKKVYMSMIDFSHNKYLILTKRHERMAKWVNMNWANNCIWRGLTVCNQQEADEKIPIFLQVPGKKFLSIEPCISKIIFPAKMAIIECPECKDGERWTNSSIPRICYRCGKMQVIKSKIDCVILGGETGPSARPLHPDWVRAVRDQCQSAGVPFFFKQWGEWAIRDSKIHGGVPVNPVIRLGEHGRDTRDLANCDENSGNEIYMQRVGRNKAGRELDGRTHDDLPWVKGNSNG